MHTIDSETLELVAAMYDWRQANALLCQPGAYPCSPLGQYESEAWGKYEAAWCRYCRKHVWR